MARQWKDTYDAFLAHPGKRDWVPKLAAV